MDGSGTIRVLKRDGRVEPFDLLKLTAAMWRGIRRDGGTFRNARDLAGAIATYLQRNGRRCVSSCAVFEMTVNVLRRVELADAAGLLETHRAWRQDRRNRIRIRHDDGKVTGWSKGWLSELAARMWRLSDGAARVLGGIIEAELLNADETYLWRHEILEMLNARVAEYGLADAVPVR